MNDRPTAPELIAAARDFLQSELIPTLSDRRLRFRTLVAANVLTIVQRELAGEETQLRAEWAWLAKVLGPSDSAPARLAPLRNAVLEANRQLCERIRGGAFDDAGAFARIAKWVREDVQRKLEVANPRYLAEFRTGEQ